MSHGWTRRLAHVALASAAVAATAFAQVDDRLSRQGLERNAARRVFAVDSRPDSPVELYQVEEVRQQLPPHRYAVRARNRSAGAIASVTIAAVVVASDGTAKAFQRLPVVKNLKPIRRAGKRRPFGWPC